MQYTKEKQPIGQTEIDVKSWQKNENWQKDKQMNSKDNKIKH